MKKLERILTEKRKVTRAIFISSYIPRKCGIATFTKDLTNAINMLNPYALAEILAVNRNGEGLNYPWEVKYKIIQNELETYLQAAHYINQSSADIISLQHEYGLFGGQDGEYIVPFAESLKTPLVTTFHTVPDNPNGNPGIILKRLANKSKAIVVVMKEIANKLIKDYQIPREKIVTIPHGTPDLPYGPTDSYKKRKQLSNRIVLGNINLLSPNKGLEYTLEAVAMIAKKYPQVLYLIIGQTHPVVLQTEGEKYRNFLKRTVKKLKINKQVRFVNQYLSLSDLVDWLKTIDIYITPYLDPQQPSSGALAYAIGAGKSCISTPYRYAKEVLDERRGILVPFRNSKAIAESVIDLWEKPSMKAEVERNAYEFGRLMTWSSVALQHLDLFQTVLDPDRKNG